MLEQYKPQFDQTIDRLVEELQMLRVGRANPAMVEQIMVEAYGATTPLKQVASITVSTARTLIIQPWDASITKDVEKAIIAANIGINPVNEGKQIRINVPQLTEESRRELVRTIGERLEKTRVAVRHIRDEIKDVVLGKEKAKEISEDARFDTLKKLDDMVKRYNDEIKTLGEKKEAELLTI